MSSTVHFDHVSAELQARHLGTYLGHVERLLPVPRPGRYELWRSPSGVLQWRGPATTGEPATLLWTDPLPHAETTIGEAFVSLWLTLGQPPAGGGSWYPAADGAGQ